MRLHSSLPSDGSESLLVSSALGSGIVEKGEDTLIAPERTDVIVVGIEQAFTDPAVIYFGSGGIFIIASSVPYFDALQGSTLTNWRRIAGKGNLIEIEMEGPGMARFRNSPSAPITEPGGRGVLVLDAEFSEDLHLVYTLTSTQRVLGRLELYDLTGRPVAGTTFRIEADQSLTDNLRVPELSRGAYIVRVVDDGGQINYGRIVKFQ